MKIDMTYDDLEIQKKGGKNEWNRIYLMFPERKSL